MKRLFLSMACLLFATFSFCMVPEEKEIRRTTVFDTFQPAVVSTIDGRKLVLRQANIFLRNGNLIYKENGKNMLANIERIKTVDIAGRHYLRADSLLAYVTDSVGRNALLEATIIDMEAFAAEMRNNRIVTDFRISDMVGITTTDLRAEEDITYPVINYFFFKTGDKVFHAEERTVRNNISKDKRRLFTAIIQNPMFKWEDRTSLIKLLKLIGNE